MNNLPKRVLVATDGSEDATLAVRAAAGISERADMELHVVHAWQGQVLTAFPTAPDTDRSFLIQAGGLGVAEEAGREDKSLRGNRCARIPKERPADEVARLAEEVRADLMVVGSRGLGFRSSVPCWAASLPKF